MGFASVKIGGRSEFIDKTGQFLIIGGWKRVTDSEYKIYYYNTKSITRTSKDILRVWIKVVPTEEGRDREIQERKEKWLPIKGFENYDHTKTLYEIDCKEKRLRTLSINHYDKEGEIIDYMDKISDWRYVVPNSIGEAFHETLCP